jgi:hypothetical protein
VFSWWGAAWPHTGHLVVGGPAVAQREAPRLLEALRGDDDLRHPRLVAVVVTAVMPAALILAGFAVYWSSGSVELATGWISLGLSWLGVSVVIWRAGLEGRERRADHHAEGSRPAPFHVRAGMDEDLWSLVHHLNSYRRADPETAEAIRRCCPPSPTPCPGDEQLLAELAAEFSGWHERPPAVIRAAAARVWAGIPRAETSPASWSWPDLTALAQSELDAYRRDRLKNTWT